MWYRYSEYFSPQTRAYTYLLKDAILQTIQDNGPATLASCSCTRLDVSFIISLLGIRTITHRLLLFTDLYRKPGMACTLCQTRWLTPELPCWITSFWSMGWHNMTDVEDSLAQWSSLTNSIRSGYRYLRKCLEKMPTLKRAPLQYKQAKLEEEKNHFFLLNCLYEKDKNIHLNDKFSLKISKISLQRQYYFPGMRFPNPTFWPCMQNRKVSKRAWNS